MGENTKKNIYAYTKSEPIYSIRIYRGGTDFRSAK